jgi:hypothetical protein
VKKAFFSKSDKKLQSHIFATKGSTDNIKYVWETAFPIFNILLHFELKTRFHGGNEIYKLCTTADFLENTFF